jgi:hypothetical protein
LVKRPALRGREPCPLLSSCSMLPAVVARWRLCRTFTPGGRPGTRGSATRLTRRRSMRSSRSCHAAHARYGNRLNRLIVVLWRAGLPINEVLSLTETDLEEQRGSVLVRHGKNDRRRQVGMDAWGGRPIPTCWLCRRGAESPCRARILRSRSASARRGACGFPTRSRSRPRSPNSLELLTLDGGPAGHRWPGVRGLLVSRASCGPPIVRVLAA